MLLAGLLERGCTAEVDAVDVNPDISVADYRNVRPDDFLFDEVIQKGVS